MWLVWSLLIANCTHVSISVPESRECLCPAALSKRAGQLIHTHHRQLSQEEVQAVSGLSGVGETEDTPPSSHLLPNQMDQYKWFLFQSTPHHCLQNTACSSTEQQWETVLKKVCYSNWTFLNFGTTKYCMHVCLYRAASLHVCLYRAAGLRVSPVRNGTCNVSLH